MKSRVHRRKDNKKALLNYEICHNHRPPYRVWVESDFLQECVSRQTTPREAVTRLLTTLGKPTLFSVCTHTWTLESLKQSGHQAALRLGQKLQYVSIMDESGEKVKIEQIKNSTDLLDRWIRNEPSIFGQKKELHDLYFFLARTRYYANVSSGTSPCF